MNIPKGVEIILGSGSPRRQSLLEQMNIQHRVELQASKKSMTCVYRPSKSQTIWHNKKEKHFKTTNSHPIKSSLLLIRLCGLRAMPLESLKMSSCQTNVTLSFWKNTSCDCSVVLQPCANNTPFIALQM